MERKTKNNSETKTNSLSTEFLEGLNEHYDQPNDTDVEQNEEDISPSTGEILYNELGLDKKTKKYLRCINDSVKREKVHQEVLNIVKKNIEGSDYRFLATEALTTWARSIDKEVDDEDRELWWKVVSEDLPEMLEAEDYDNAGQAISYGLKDGSTKLDKLQDQPGFDGMSENTVRGVVGSFINAGYVRRNMNKSLALTNRAKSEQRPLGYSTLHNVDMARRLLKGPDESDEIRSVHEIYKNAYKKSTVPELDLITRRKDAKIAYFSDLLLGYKYSAVDSYVSFIEQMNEQPKSERPDAIVMSGLVYGDFKLRNKRARETLAENMDSMDKQFSAAKEMIDLAKTTGAKVIYNMSSEDRNIAEEATIETFRRMKDLTKGSDSGDAFVSYYREDQYKQDPAWNTHLDFQRDVVFPYCMRAGRRLRSADEMIEATNGAIDVEEYFMLFDNYQRMQTGGKPDKSYLEWLESNGLQIPGQEKDGLTIVDDFNLNVKTRNKKYKDWIRDNFNYSSKSASSSYMRNANKLIGQLASDGDQVPSELILMNPHESVGTQRADNTAIVATGGLLHAKQMLESRASTTDIPGDPARKYLTSRNRIPEPNAVMRERTDDGRTLVTFYNEKLIDKSESAPDRTSVVLLCDWQTGSVSARPDLQVKYLDWINKNVISKGPTVIAVGGDMVHGRNYPDFPNESQRTGLMSMQSQIEFAKSIIRSNIDNLSKGDVENIAQVVVEPGNHEWNSGAVKWNGYPFVDFIRDAFEGMYERKGLEPKVDFHEAMLTDKGEALKTWSGVTKVGENGILVQHFAMNKGNANMPIYQSAGHAAGVGELKSGIDYELYGHWHHPQYGLFGNKLAVVGGSLAGLTGFEWMKGLRPVMGGTILHIGGGLPPQLELLSEETLHNHSIKKGRFAEKNLPEDDKGFDVTRHGIMFPRQYPKSGLQKELLGMMHDASAAANTSAELHEYKNPS